MNVKREQKSKNSVLIDLFYEDESAEKNQISLYNALHEKPLPDGAKIIPLRVENIIYMNFQNDFSYEADGKALLEQNAYELAIKECIKKGILADYLKKKGSEVINMLQAEYDYELDIEVQREEAYADGLRAGEQSGEKKGIQKGIQEERISLIVKKVRRGKDLITIAEELEEPIENIREIYGAIQKSAPDYDMDTICKSLA